MALTLRVTSYQSEALGAQSTRTFGAEGGSIGRSQSNDWVLPDPERFVSSSHAVVVCRNGAFFLRDASTNGTFVNGSPQPIGNGREQALNDGDRLQMGEYEIAVSFEWADQRSVTGPTGFNMHRGGSFATSPSGATGPSRGATGPRSTTGPTVAPAPLAGLGLEDFGQPGSADPLDFFGQPAAPARSPNDPGVLADHAPALDHFYQPPEPVAAPPGQGLGGFGGFDAFGDSGGGGGGGSGIPEDWDKTGYKVTPRREAAPYGAAPVPPGPPAMPPPMAAMPPSPAAASQGFGAAAGDTGSAVAAMLAAAGLDPNTARAAAQWPELAAVLGHLLGVAVQGMLEVLKARTEIKSQFRVPVTTMRPVENNPLKFSANAAQALQSLFAMQNQAYLGPVEAFAEGFRDLKAHQIATMAGMRAAFDSMLSRFDPEELETRFEKHLKRASLLNLSGKGKYWDLYRDLYEEWTQDADVNFQRLFGEKFAQAYEEQMRRLTAVRR